MIRSSNVCQSERGICDKSSAVVIGIPMTVDITGHTEPIRTNDTTANDVTENEVTAYDVTDYDVAY